MSRRARWLRLGLSGVAVSAASLVGIGAVASTQGAAGAPQSCGFADPGSGTYANTLCWFDLSGYDATTAASAAGQPMTISLPGGYSMSFTLSVTGSAVKATGFPTWSGAYLGNNGYTGVSGNPALYQTTSGTTTATLTNVIVTDAGNNPVTTYSLVGADAESTDPNESITWTSSSVITSLTATSSGDGIGNACGGGFSGVNTTTVTCLGSNSGKKTGTAILASQAPSMFSQKMVGSGLEGVGFGVLLTGLELKKTVVNGFSGDNFKISVADSSATVLGSATTGGGATASTGPVKFLTSAGGEMFTLSEAAVSGTLANYSDSWNCTLNGAPDSSLPSGDAGASATVTLGIGDFVICTITNTGADVSLALTKHADVPVDANADGLTDAGDTIGYTFTVRNTGDIDMDGVAIDDPLAGPVTCLQSVLAPGDSETCTADARYTITAADVTAGSVHNTATASGTPAGTTVTVTSPPSSTTTPTTAPDPSLTIAKSVLPTSVLNAGQGVAYSYLITNTGNVPIHGVGVSEVPGSFTGTGTVSAVSCPPGAAVLAPTISVTCTATYDVTQPDIDAGSVSNTADATGIDPDGDPVTSPMSTAKFTTTPTAALTVVKSASPSGLQALKAGKVITFSFVVTNTGNVTVKNVVVTDGLFSGTGTLSPIRCPAGVGSLAPAAQVTCTATYTVTQADVDAGTLSNTATAAGTPPAGVPGSVTSPPSTVVVPGAQNPALAIVKTASPRTFSKPGQTIAFSYQVTNTGNVTITSVTAIEKHFTGTGTLSAITCPSSAGSLPPAAHVTCTATYRVTQHDVDAGAIVNTAVGSGDDPGHTITSPPSTVKVSSTAASKLALVKTAHAVDVNHDGAIDRGDRIDWTLVATNVGATTITGIVVSDPTAGAVACPATSLAPGASMTCGVPSRTITEADVTAGHVRNTATATGTVTGTVSITSPPAHATVDVHNPSDPEPKGVLPFTGFAVSSLLTTIAVVLIALGSLLILASVTRRRSV